MFESEHVLFSRMKIASGDEEVLFQPPLRLFIAAKIMFNLMPLSAVQNMICFIYFHSCHCHHRVYYKLTMACSPVSLISSMKGQSVASGHRGGQGSIPDHVLFQLLRLFIPLRRTCSLSCLCPQFKILLITYISIIALCWLDSYFLKDLPLSIRFRPTKKTV